MTTLRQRSSDGKRRETMCGGHDMTLHFVLTRPVGLLNLASRSIRIDVECNLYGAAARWGSCPGFKPHALLA